MAAKVEDKNEIPELLNRMKQLSSHHVEIGVWGQPGEESILMIASVHEFGVQIEVTPRMRAFLHHIGIHLKKDTTHINIPERSFIRAGFDSNKRDITQLVDRLIEDVIFDKISVPTMFELIGAEIVGMIQEYMTDLRDPPNHPVTIDRKGSSNPLIDTGRIRGAIAWRVVQS